MSKRKQREDDLLQKSSCHQQASYVRCFKCKTGRATKGSTACRFNGIRTLNGPPIGLLASKRQVPWTPAEVKLSFNRRTTRAEITAKLSNLSNILLPILQNEALHQEHPETIYRSRTRGMRDQCERCNAQTFCGSFVCRCCGRDLCMSCGQDMKRLALPILNDGPSICTEDQHPADALQGVTFFTASELQCAIEEMTSLLRGEPVPLAPLTKDDVSIPGHIPVLDRRSPDFDEQFFFFWSKGIPILVDNCLDNTSMDSLDRHYFIKKHGKEPVKLVDCEGRLADVSSTLGAFLSGFGMARSPSAPILKVKDWPAKRMLSQAAPELYRELERTVPAPDYTRADGVSNILAYFPSDACPPDPGPKMYLAHSSIRNGVHVGSTCLHKDITAAYNLSLEGRALWTIWPSWSSDMLCEFIFNKGLASRGDGNPIHRQIIYLGEDDTHEFASKYEVAPFIFQQRPGQMVFIPSNCPHQVSNEDECIKYANDVLSEVQLAEVLTVQTELRDHRLRQQPFERLEDVLQIFQTMWYAWRNLSERLRALPQVEDDPPQSGYAEMIQSLNESLNKAMRDKSVHLELAEPRGGMRPPSSLGHGSVSRSVHESAFPEEAEEVQPSKQGYLASFAPAEASVYTASASKNKNNRRNRENKRDHRDEKPTLCAPDDNKIFRCPCLVQTGKQQCARILNGAGLLDHLQSTHSDVYRGVANRKDLLKTSTRDPPSFYRFVWGHIDPSGRYFKDDPRCDVSVGRRIHGRVEYA